MNLAILATTILAVAGGGAAVPTGTAAAPVGRPMHGPATFYDTPGVGACGKQVRPKKKALVAVPSIYWTAANPNNDPICNLKVRVTFGGKTITVPVEDKCPSCGPRHIDLSKKAFAKLANPGRGRIAVTWKFVR